MSQKWLSLIVKGYFGRSNLKSAIINCGSTHTSRKQLHTCETKSHQTWSNTVFVLVSCYGVRRTSQTNLGVYNLREHSKYSHATKNSQIRSCWPCAVASSRKRAWGVIASLTVWLQPSSSLHGTASLLGARWPVSPIFQICSACSTQRYGLIKWGAASWQRIVWYASRYPIASKHWPK